MFGMLGADVMKDTGHRALHPEIEALDRIGVNRTANIFAARMLNGLVRGEVLADSDKRLPLVAHQVGPGLDLFVEHAFDFIHRKIGDHRGAGIAGGGALRGCAGPLHHRQDRALHGPPQTFAPAARRRLAGALLRPSAEKELIDLDRAAKRVLASQHQAQGMSNAPSRRLAHPKRLSEANRGQPLVRLQDQLQYLEPGAQRQLGGVQWHARRRGELKTADAIRALIQTRPRPVPAHVAPRQRNPAL
jgi:hypothetical protein